MLILRMFDKALTDDYCGIISAGRQDFPEWRTVTTQCTRVWVPSSNILSRHLDGLVLVQAHLTCLACRYHHLLPLVTVTSSSMEFNNSFTLKSLILGLSHIHTHDFILYRDKRHKHHFSGHFYRRTRNHSNHKLFGWTNSAGGIVKPFSNFWTRQQKNLLSSKGSPSDADKCFSLLLQLERINFSWHPVIDRCTWVHLSYLPPDNR